MKVGAWFHGGEVTLESQITDAARLGMDTLRCYDIAYAEKVAPVARQTGMSLMAGMHVDGDELLADWRSQVRLDELARYHELGVPLEAICVGNELREGGFDSTAKKFSARLSFALSNVLAAYRQWLDGHGCATPLTYAAEGIIFDDDGTFHEWIWPLIDACGVFSLNLYPMDYDAWFTFGAFEESRRLLHDARERHRRFCLFELRLRRILDQLARCNKKLILTETGFPSAAAYELQDDLVVPMSDHEAYAAAMGEFVDIIRRVDADCNGQIAGIYFYEWRDNLRHSAIAEWESPIHCAFGLCDRFGRPKFDLSTIL